MSKISIIKKSINNCENNLVWQCGSQNSNIIIENKRINVKILRYNIVNENGEVIYDTIAINESELNTVIVLIDENENIGLLYEWRPIPEKWFWACIRGFADKDDINPLSTAKREVFEEIGIKFTDSAIDLGTYYQNTSYFENPTNVILLKVKNDIKPHLEKEEGILKLEFFSKEQIYRMINDREITCQHTLAALCKYFIYSNK